MIDLPDPLHPAVVHLPMALAAVLPIFAVLFLVAGARARRAGRSPRGAWVVPCLVAALLAAGSLAAVETGEEQEDWASARLGEDALREHEEAGELFRLLAGVELLLCLLGLAGGTLGSSSRAVATLGAFLLGFFALQSGHTGGELVYGEGPNRFGPRADAARGYTPPPRRPDEGD